MMKSIVYILLVRLAILSSSLALAPPRASPRLSRAEHVFSTTKKPRPLKASSTSTSRRISQWPTQIFSTDQHPTTKTAAIRRFYETYLWKGRYNINYRVEGDSDDGTPILLIHGFGSNINHYRYQFPALVDAGFRVYAIDLLGFGGSDKPGDYHLYSIENWAQLCFDFCNDMQQEQQQQQQQPWVLAGNSIGGLCALATAEILFNNTKACVLFNCAQGMNGFRYEDVPLCWKPIIWFVQKVILGPVLGGPFFENYFKSRKNIKYILKLVYRDTTNVDDALIEILSAPADDIGAKDVFLNVFGGLPGPTPESILSKLESLPILALWGEADPWTPVDRGKHPGKDFSNYAKNFTLMTIPGAGHCPHDECPDQVNEKLITWLKAI